MQDYWKFALVALGIYFMLRKPIDKLSPRPLRLNNPMAIKEFHSRYIDWVGEHPEDLDPTLEEFTRPEFGYRAGGRILDIYWRDHDIRTVREMLTRYAPGVENDTDSYIAHVSEILEVHPDTELDLEARKLEIVKAITKHENGFIPHSDEFIWSALQIA